jgi:diaminohydroxyphosphoribosylaminopyrimidine deaminase/5-amino-6-(5-phosphoribosylamino)uracil reductase
METPEEISMRRALTEARKVLGFTHPNPAVGAVICHRGEIVASGATQPAGGNHAEIEALKGFTAGGFEPDVTTVLYVTMEPCSTTGRTGPCTSAIIASGIRKVCLGTVDPNPIHSGRGVEVLRAAGLQVSTGILAEECAALNIIFNHWITHGRPLMAGKIATTIDGRTATRSGFSKWITGQEARQDVHFWRRAFPAIAVGAGTLLADDPALTIREEGVPESCAQRFVFDRSLVSFQEETVQVYTDHWRDQTIVISSEHRAAEAERLQARYGIRFWLFDDPMTEEGLNAFSQRCAEMGLTGVYIEGGAQVLSSFLQARALDYLFAYRSNKLLADESGLAPFGGFAPGGMDQTIRLTNIMHAVFGEDQLMRGTIYYPDEGAAT